MEALILGRLYTFADEYVRDSMHTKNKHLLKTAKLQNVSQPKRHRSLREDVDRSSEKF